jgi:hypothetical protein
LKICNDFKKFNVTTKKDLYSLPFTNEVINTIGRHEVYTFLDGFLGYHHISIAPKEQHKTVIVTYLGAFVWVVMPVGVKNGLPTYQRVVIKAFCVYINVFMNFSLDDFIVFSDLSTHLEKLKNVFLNVESLVLV